MIIKGVEEIIGVLIGVAYITLGERKIMGSMQRRVGPGVIGIYGLIQPLVDGGKLLIKELREPQQAERGIYIIAPMITLILAIIINIGIPLGEGSLIENEYGIIYILAVSSMSALVLIFTGWGSKTKYTTMGGVRAIAQLISYEVSIGIIIMCNILLQNSLDLTVIKWGQIGGIMAIGLFPMLIIYIISAIAECNRPPFDLAEAESELVAGVITEYGGMGFAYIYLAEYAFMQSMSLLGSILYFGTILVTPLILFIYIWARASLPRVRYDQLMKLGWTQILPFSISYYILIISVQLLIS